jgi:hypothetical protein
MADQSDGRPSAARFISSIEINAIAIKASVVAGFLNSNSIQASDLSAIRTG